jgi:hypothetical protein
LDQGVPIERERRDHLIVRSLARAALNLSLMLTHYGCKVGDPVDPKQYHKHRSSPKFEHFAVSDFRTIDMLQFIVVRKTHSGTLHDEEPIPSGREMPPHWRRGHWRNQPWGPGAQKRKLIFIQPMLVRSDRAVGDLADSQAVYQISD